jgi:hypothetical protein
MWAILVNVLDVLGEQLPKGLGEVMDETGLLSDAGLGRIAYMVPFIPFVPLAAATGA